MYPVISTNQINSSMMQFSSNFYWIKVIQLYVCIYRENLCFVTCFVNFLIFWKLSMFCIFLRFHITFVCLSRFDHVNDWVSYFRANKCRRICLAKPNDRRGRHRTWFLKYPLVQESLSQASLQAATLPTMSAIPAFHKMGDEIILFVSKFHVHICRNNCFLHNLQLVE